MFNIKKVLINNQAKNYKVKKIIVNLIFVDFLNYFFLDVAFQKIKFYY